MNEEKLPCRGFRQEKPGEEKSGQPTRIRTSPEVLDACPPKTVGRKRLVQTWSDMKQRCYNPNNRSFHRYGGRGISVCDRWLESFEDFRDDMGPKPEGMSLDRRDNNGDYTPENCRWATRAQQEANKCCNVYIDGLTQAEFARKIGVTETCVRRRRKFQQPLGMQKHTLAKGEHFHSAKLTSEQVIQIRKETVEGVSVTELSVRLGVKRNVIWAVLRGDTYTSV